MYKRMVFLVLLVLGLSFAGLSVSNYSLTKGVYKPGEPGVATITVSNPTGDQQVSGITLTIDAPPELAITSSPQLADISAGGSAVLSIPFKIRQDAKPGVYLLSAVFKGFQSGGGTGLSQSTVNTVSVPVTVVNEPELSFSVDKTLLTGIDLVVLTINNNGGSAKNVKLSIPSDVSLFGADKLYLGTISGQNKTLLELDSRNAADGPASVVLRLDYEDEIGLSHVENFTLRMTVRNEKLNLRFDQEGEVVTGKESNITLQIHNDGSGSLKDVRLVFLNNSIRLKDQNELKFGDIGPGQSASASAVITTDLPPGSNAVESQLSYIEKDVQKQESIKVPIAVTSDADVGVYLEAKPLPLTVGSQHTLSVLVSNLGTYKIDSVDVSVSSPALRPLDISEKQYIGGLQSDDFSTVQFQTSVNATGEGDYPIRITVTYRDPSGEWKHKNIDRTITVYQQTAKENGTFPVIVGLVAFGGLLIWFFRFRKKHQQAG
ncbi:MAG: LPXTG cell wall anchor domain-containing protein [Candidatus Micrarchaeia archaeon]